LIDEAQHGIRMPRREGNESEVVLHNTSHTCLRLDRVIHNPQFLRQELMGEVIQKEQQMDIAADILAKQQ